MISSERGHSSHSPLIGFLSILDKILGLLEYQEPFDKVQLPYQTHILLYVYDRRNTYIPLFLSWNLN